MTEFDGPPRAPREEGVTYSDDGYWRLLDQPVVPITSPPAEVNNSSDDDLDLFAEDPEYDAAAAAIAAREEHARRVAVRDAAAAEAEAAWRARGTAITVDVQTIKSAGADAVGAADPVEAVRLWMGENWRDAAAGSSQIDLTGNADLASVIHFAADVAQRHYLTDSNKRFATTLGYAELLRLNYSLSDAQIQRFGEVVNDVFDEEMTPGDAAAAVQDAGAV